MNGPEDNSPDSAQIKSSKKIDIKKYLTGLRGKIPLGRRSSTIPEIVLPTQPSVPEEEPKPKGIADFVKEEIDKKELQPPEFKNEGSSGFGGTNERIDPKTLTEVAKSPDAPNGYLIGVGVSNILSLLDTFPDGVVPKGIVLINPDPNVIPKAQRFVEILAEGKNVSLGSGEMPFPHFGKVVPYEDPEKYFENAYSGGQKKVNAEAVIRNHHQTLVNLAKSGNIAVIQQNLFNPELLEILSRLPDLKNSNNVVYLSNVANWIWRPIGWDMWEKRVQYYFDHGNKSDAPEDYPYIPDMSEIFKIYENLKVVEPTPPHTNYYADTLSKKYDGGLGYGVRVQKKIPTFSRQDFTLID